MSSYWPLIIVIVIALIGVILHLIIKKDDFEPNSNYQNKDFENFLNVLKDATDEQDTQESLDKEE